MTKYDAIYISPHLDDAALSCGGQIFTRTRAGESILIISIMAGDPMKTAVSNFAHSLHQRWELDADIVAARRDEDRVACSILGADYLHWEMPDCIYRVSQQSGTAFYDSEEGIFGAVHPEDMTHWQDPLAQLLHSLPSHKQIIAPLTIGHHVDHQLVRTVAEHIFAHTLTYYEDYPYTQKLGELDTIIDRSCWYDEVIELDEDAIQAKVEAILAFRSQISTFFNGRLDLEQQIKTYQQQVGGERLWRKQID